MLIETFTFGKYKGRSMMTVPDGYLVWLLENDIYTPLSSGTPACEAAEKELEFREDGVSCEHENENDEDKEQDVFDIDTDPQYLR